MAAGAPGFFDGYPAFLDSSETGPHLARLNARHQALIEGNRHLLEGARVLDLASHDGRFSFAALHAGAAHVVAIDHKETLVRAARDHFEEYGIAPDRYELLVGDVYEALDAVGPVDVVLCFGLLYHLTDHMRLFTRLAELGPRTIVLDTHTSPLDGSVVEVRSPLAPGAPEPGAELEGHPSRAALEAMLASFGWTFEYVDWHGGGLADGPEVGDYASGKRVSLTITCPEHDVPAETREQAVLAALLQADDRDTQVLVLQVVAERFGVPPEALRTWCRAEERRLRREAGYRLPELSPAERRAKLVEEIAASGGLADEPG